MAYTIQKICGCGVAFKGNSNRQKYCSKCKVIKRLERQKRYNQTYYQQNVDYMYEKSTNYNQSERGKASEKLRSAVRSGKIERQPCEVCGGPDAHGHHEDYSKPLEVVWLCQKHHAERHLKEPWQIELRKAGYEGGFLLGELIEACGDGFMQLNRKHFCVNTVWNAYTHGMNVYYSGPTPEEAVKNLWIALNEK